jgi:TRAP transporter 4TM/12TM fusion protein
MYADLFEPAETDPKKAELPNDRLSSGRRCVGVKQKIVSYSRWLSDAAALIFAGLATYIAGFGVFEDTLVLAGTTGIPMVISVLAFSGQNMDQTREEVSWLSILSNYFLLVALAVVFYFMITRIQQNLEIFVDFTETDFIIGWLGFAIVFYLTLRHFGLPIFLVLVAAVAYVLLAHNLPGALNAPEIKWFSVSEKLWYSTDGVFGRPVAVVGQIVLVYILFGAVLEASGAGATLLKFAFAATGRLRGGPAHAAIVASATFGTINGSAVANVVSTGVFTIPMIKRAGFSPRFAGAVEATASTGGQLMPPVMGAVAFLMADITGIPYLTIIVAAAIPAVLYYISIFAVVWLEARKQGIKPVPKEERANLAPLDWLCSLSFFGPLGIIVYMLLDGSTAQLAGFWGMMVALVISLMLYPDFRSLRKILSAFVRGGRTAASVMIVVAGIGFVVGVINMTGIGIKFASVISDVAGTSLFLSLIVVMIGCLILGMGVPTGAAYLIIVLIIGPVLGKLGLSLLAIHLFIIYFGVLSAITPPVAIAAFAAAPIAGSGPIETGIVSIRLAIAGFLIPFIMIYHPSVLIVEEFSWVGLAWAIGAFLLSTAAISTSLGAFSFGHIGIIQRIIRLVAGLSVLVPDAMIAAISVAVILASFFVERMIGVIPVKGRTEI